MKEYGNKLEIYLLEDIASITGTSISMNLSKTPIIILTSNDILPDEQPGQNNGSLYYTQNLIVFTDKLSETSLNNILERKVIVKLFFGEEEEVLIGSLNNPARCTTQPHINQDTIKITCESPNSMLS